jgi:hypothetical protein
MTKETIVDESLPSVDNGNTDEKQNIW